MDDRATNHTFGYSDIADLTLVQLAGERLAPPDTNPTETTLTINAQYDADSLAAAISVQATVHLQGNFEAARYRGSIRYRLNFYGPVDSAENSVLINLLWPYLRSGLLEHAGRLGEGALTVPLQCPQLPPSGE